MLKPENNYRVYYLLSGLILIAALIARVYQIDLRPLHSDEAVNHFFLQKISALGFYPYSHENYHGPLYFYVSWLFYYFIGDSELWLRMPSILFGCGIVCLPILLRKYLTWPGVLIAQFFFAFSTAALYHSRYAIHETCFLFFVLLLGICLFRYSTKQKTFDLYCITISLAALICIKETYIISLAVLACSALILFYENLPKRPASIYPFLAVFLIIIITCYSGFFLWFEGLREIFKSIPQWIGRNETDVGHFKPWYYYLKVLWGIEYQLFASILLLAFVRFNRLGFYLLSWSLLTLLIYSIPIDYKTPWLIINLTYPWYLFLAWQFAQVKRKNIFWKSALLLCISICLLTTWHYNFNVTQGRGNPLAYVHTHNGVKRMSNDIRTFIASESAKTGRVLIAPRAYWPLPYYLRESAAHLSFAKPEKVNLRCNNIERYDILVLNKHVPINCPGWRSKYYRLADHQEVLVWYRYI